MSDIIERFYGEELQAAREESKIEGQDNLSYLISKLFRENRMDDAQRVVNDKIYREKLLNEMFPQEVN